MEGIVTRQYDDALHWSQGFKVLVEKSLRRDIDRDNFLAENWKYLLPGLILKVFIF
ncbi:hypothetical protein CIPAW_06G141500 [Carya illinoinensis]|uniref:Uncharacterized protein n=1 Tax=Carya illinoinensis TaxID=32201 RepID=A0A8T1QBF8_CARIL|nr:hypothetical protein CIPAW_06G141500 [Carya illinoinensis]